MINKVFITSYLDVRRPSKKTGLYPLRLRVKDVHKTKFYGTGLNFSKEYYEKITKGKRLTQDEQNHKLQIEGIEKKAKDIIKELDGFTFERFERVFIYNSDKVDLFDYFKQYREELIKGGKYSTAEIYLNSEKALKRFIDGNKLPFKLVTPEFLREFTNYILNNKRSITTVSLYIRSIRTLFNKAIYNKDVKEYPFYNSKTNPQGYKIPMPTKGKKAFTDIEIKKILEYIPTEKQKFWYDVFVFSYYAGGINIKDIALLKQVNVNGNNLSFTRKKTEHTTPREVNIPLNDRARKILDYWNTDNEYIFPFITKDMNNEEIHNAIKFKTKNINKVMKKICTSININTPVSTYTARHTFASKLARSGAPILLISDSLAHSSIKTTQNYLNSFPSDEKTKWFDML